MTSRQRVVDAINHRKPDRVPVDLGSTGQTGISASTLYRLRKALNMDSGPIKVHEPFQMLGEVDKELVRAFNVDIIGLWSPTNMLGIKNENWKPWQMPDGTPVLMAQGFEYDVGDDGSIYAYPQGDRTAMPSVRLPKGGFFFDNIERSGDFDEDDLDAERDFGESFQVMDDETANYLEKESIRLFEETDLAIVGNWGGGGFGDVALIPGPSLKNPRGIRKIEDWLVAHILYPDYIMEVFELQAESALKNLEIYKQAVGNRIQVINVSGTDFGTQNGAFISPEVFRKLYKPFYRKINDWIHKNTEWKTFYHSCGSIISLLDDLIDSGVDIINPVQCSAYGMDPEVLKQKYGDKIVFWGGGVDTQKILPFGTPEDVQTQVKERLKTFSAGGGYVFCTIHNIVAKTPVENIIAMFDAIREFND
ncbi:MAG TPA: methyltransferase [Clostridiaceae bacterium]|jgi:hypothetical protein|nr:methyltransferase [Clostridiaceae bacterium]